MNSVGPYVFKQADSADEVEQIHALNYRTFVREIPQHADTGDGRLVDKFHDKNRYFVALRDGRVVGMLAVHDQPPFSIDSRLPDPTLLTAPGTRPLEIRLLSVVPEERGRIVFVRLVSTLFDFVRRSGHTHLFISGIEDRLPLYQGLGFQALGEPIGPEGARFVPMSLSVTRLESLQARTAELWNQRVARTRGPLPS
ncbi:MAG: GNAT family N-acetyltransferase [Planctomycetes bacterium]|nr:GNAT family N-acetyltransferase [Planctomycetota bacterium]